MGQQWNRVRQLLRTCHRDLGYFLLGACVIYGLSGMALSLRRYNVNFLCSKTTFTATLAPALSKDSLLLAWDAHKDKLPRVREVQTLPDGYKLTLPSGSAQYNTATGEVLGVSYTPTQFLKLLHRMHFNGQGTFKIMGILFGLSLLFLALSGAVIVTGKKGFMRRGIWFMLGGIALIIFLAVITF